MLSQKVTRIFLIILALLVGTVTALDINADHQNFASKDVDAHGNGWWTAYAANDFHNAHAIAHLSVQSGTKLGFPYTHVVQVAGFWTVELSSNGERNIGARFLHTCKTGPDNAIYEGKDSDYLISNVKAWFLSPKQAGGCARAHVDPYDDSDAGPVKVPF